MYMCVCARVCVFVCVCVSYSVLVDKLVETVEVVRQGVLPFLQVNEAFLHLKVPAGEKHPKGALIESVKPSASRSGEQVFEKQGEILQTS